MDVALNIRPQVRGEELLWYHCTLLGRWDEHRLPAQTRLEQTLGPELTRLLLSALATTQGRRGSSSP